MQYDMHYYGTYAIACAAGIPREDAEIIAHSSQNVDDQEATKIEIYDDSNGLLRVATAHHPLIGGARSVLPSNSLENDTRMVWVPFHFLPGNQGSTFEERLTCQKNSEIALEMINNCCNVDFVHSDVGLRLAGITAHVYADTFSHYGFLGVSSTRNKIKQGSIKYGSHHSDTAIQHIKERWQKFKDRFDEEITQIAPLGHGTVATMPDRPFLKFRFQYEDGRDSGWRDNPTNFIEGCYGLYEFFIKFAKNHYGKKNLEKPVKWDKIADTIKQILLFEGSAKERASAWVDAMSRNEIPNVVPPSPYVEHPWDALPNLNRLFQAAADHHRTYVLRTLLPKYDILVI